MMTRAVHDAQVIVFLLPNKCPALIFSFFLCRSTILPFGMVKASLTTCCVVTVSRSAADMFSNI
jgi:hypothetical protein